MPETELPQVETAAEPIVAAPPAPITITLENMSEFTPEQQHYALFGGKPPAVAAKPPVEKPTEAVGAPPVVAPPEKILPNRINTAQFDPEEQEAIALKHDLMQKGEKITLMEAGQRVAAKYAATRPPPEPEPPAAPVENPFESLEQEVKALLDRRPEFVDQFGEEKDAFEDQLAEAREKLISAKLTANVLAETLKTVASETKKQTAARVAAERVSAREASMAEALAVYKTADADDSALNLRITAKFNKINANPDHPERARFFDQTDGPKWLVEQAAAEYAAEIQGYGFTAEQAMESVRSGNPPTRARSPVPVVPPPKAQQLPVPRGLVTTTRVSVPPPVAPTMTLEEILRRGTDDEAFRKAILFGPNKRR